MIGTILQGTGLLTWVHTRRALQLTTALGLHLQEHHQEGTARGVDTHALTQETIEDTCLPRHGATNKFAILFVLTKMRTNSHRS